MNTGTVYPLGWKTCIPLYNNNLKAPPQIWDFGGRILSLKMINLFLQEFCGIFSELSDVIELNAF